MTLPVHEPRLYHRLHGRFSTQCEHSRAAHSAHIVVSPAHQPFCGLKVGHFLAPETNVQAVQVACGPGAKFLCTMFGQIARNGNHSLPVLQTRPVNIPDKAPSAPQVVAQKAHGEDLLVIVEVLMLA